MKGWYKALEDLVWLTQLGLNMLLPLVMCLGGAWWAVNNWSWPEWVFLPAILLGITSAYLFSREWLMRFNDRITLHWWIFAVGALFVAVIVACVALWQTHRSAHGDPIKMIRTE